MGEHDWKAPGAGPILSADAPGSWSDFPWPEWVPNPLRGQIEEFWGCFGRDPASYLRNCEQPGGLVFGRVYYDRNCLFRRDEVWSGRWVHCWNNMGRLVTASADRGFVCTSFPGPAKCVFPYIGAAAVRAMKGAE